MNKRLTYAALLAAMVFGTQAWTMAEDGAKAPADPSVADQTSVRDADDSAKADDSQDPATDDTDSAADDTAAAEDDAARPAAGRNVAGKAAKAGKARAADDQAHHGNKDQQFVKHAASGGMFEVAKAQLAVERAQSDELKQYAQRIIDDHTKANEQLKQIAQSRGIQLDEQMMPIHQLKLKELSKKQGEDFERCYLYGDLACHVHDVLSFRDAAQDLEAQELKDFASQQLPTLKEHLARAAQLANWEEATTAGATERATTPAPGGSQQRPGAAPGQPGDTGDPDDSDAGTDTDAIDAGARDSAGDSGSKEPSADQR